MGEGGGESINFKTKRHNCASAHHSLNVRYNVKRSQLKQRQKKGGGGGRAWRALLSYLTLLTSISLR